MKKNVSLKNGMKILALLLVAAIASVSAQAADWDGEGANDLWSTAANWVGDTVPVANDPVSQQLGDSVYDLGDLNIGGNLMLDSKDANPVSMTFNTGNMTLAGWMTQSMGGAGGTGTGTYNIGGTATVTVAGGFSLVNDNNATADGVLNMSGGTLTIGSGFYIGAGDDGLIGTLNMSGGTITTNNASMPTYIGYAPLGGTGIANVSGGAWFPNNLAMQTGTGVVNLSGGFIALNYLTMVTAGDVIDITDTGVLYASLADGLTVEADVEAAVAAGYITGNGIAGNVVNLGNIEGNGYAKFVVVPEPATIFLISLGCLGCLALRKRKV